MLGRQETFHSCKAIVIAAVDVVVSLLMHNRLIGESVAAGVGKVIGCCALRVGLFSARFPHR